MIGLSFLLVAQRLETEGALELPDRPLVHAVTGMVVVGVHGRHTHVMRVFLESAPPPSDSFTEVLRFVFFRFQLFVVDTT